MDMIIGGLISTAQEAKEIESIIKSFVVAKRSRFLGSKS
jgi:hypothetical protein